MVALMCRAVLLTDANNSTEHLQTMSSRRNKTELILYILISSASVVR